MKVKHEDAPPNPEADPGPAVSPDYINRGTGNNTKRQKLVATVAPPYEIGYNSGFTGE